MTRAIFATELEAIELSGDMARDVAVRAEYAVQFILAGNVLRASFERAGAAAIFAQRYRVLLAPGEPIDFTMACADVNGTMLFVTEATRTGSASALAWRKEALDDAATVFLGDAVILAHFLRASEHLISFHAAAIHVEGVAVALVGDSAAGKTTTAIACVRRGLRLYSDERCILRDGCVEPFPRSLNLRADGIARLLADPLAEPHGIDERLRSHPGGWDNVSFPELFGPGDVLAPRARLAHAFFIAGSGERVAITAMSTWHMVAVAAKWMQSPWRGMDRLDAARRAFEGVGTARLTLGSPDATARAIAAHVRAERAGR